MTKTRHFVSRLVGALFLFCTLAAVPSIAMAAPGDLLQSGMTVDCARRYYSIDTLKGFIDTLSGYEGAFLQLHLTDDQNVGVECSYLGQTTASPNVMQLPDGSWQNTQTNKQFLSADQIAELISYANQKGVEIIPEIDAPAHMEGFFTLAELKNGSAYADALAYDRNDYPGELDISSPASIDFVKRLYDDYATLFSGCTYFHIGCDELWSGTLADKTAYINTMASYMQNKGFTVRMWNDLMRKDNIDTLNHAIEVTYWSYDGDAQDPDECARRRAVRANVADLQAAGYDVLIYNSYYLYYVPSPSNYNTHDNDYAVNDVLENWTIKKWDSNSGAELAGIDHIIGSATSLWSENSEGITEADVASHFSRLYRAMAHVNKESNDYVLRKPVVTGAVAESDSITVTWRPDTDATGYRVFRKTASGTWEQISGDLPATPATSATQVSFTDTTAVPDITYYYSVCASFQTPTIGVVWSGVQEPGVEARIEKNTYPEFSKTVDKQDVMVGQMVTFTLNGQVPFTAGYTAYEYKITDTLSAGFTLEPANLDLVVCFGGDVISPSAYRLSVANSTIELVFDDMTAHQAYAGAPITVTYRVRVNDQAIAQATQNSAILEYSNDPAHTSSRGLVGPVSASVYTSRVTVKKVDASNQSHMLPGAGFILIKKSSDPCEYYVYDSQTGYATWSQTEADATVITTDANGVAQFNVNDGTYALKEVQAPLGYELSDREQEITVEHERETATSPPIGIEKDITITNVSTYTLPETGGSGDTLFYLFGGVLFALGCGIFVRWQACR